MMRIVPRSPRGTWLLAGAVWLAGCGALWWVLPYRPRASWPTQEPAELHGFVPGTSVLLTSSPWNSSMIGHPERMHGPLLARDAATGRVREWFPNNERLMLVDPGVDGKHVLIGRVLGGRTRLFLHDASSGVVVAELPRGRPRTENENGLAVEAYEPFAVFRRDGRQVAYADRVDDQCWLRVYDLDAGEEVAAIPGAGPPAAWSPDGRTLAYASKTRDAWKLYSWDLVVGNTCALDSSPMVKRRPTQTAFSPDGHTLVAELWPILEPGEEGHIQVVGWDVATGNERWRHDAGDASFFANLEWFVTYDGWDLGFDQLFHRRDYSSGSELDRMLPSASTVHSLSPDGRLLLGSGWYNPRIFALLAEKVLGRSPDEPRMTRPTIWDVGSGKLKYSLPAAVKECVPIRSRSAWSADGTLLAIAGEDTLGVWDMPPGKPLTWFAGGAVLIALPPFTIARRRVRRLRREAAA